MPAKPLPISNPLAAGSDSIALARSASSLSNTGSPSPGGTPRATASTTPPSESPAFRASSMRSIMRSAVAASGQRTMLASTASRVTVAASTVASMSATRSTQATMSTGWSPRAAAQLASSWRATAPAATRPTVSRALARPPPCQARMPYFAL